MEHYTYLYRMGFQRDDWCWPVPHWYEIILYCICGHLHQNHISHGHFGVLGIYEKLALHYIWALDVSYDITRHIYKAVNRCHTGWHNSTQWMKDPIWSWPGRPFATRLDLDVKGPIDGLRNKWSKQYIIVTMDYLTKWCECARLYNELMQWRLYTFFYDRYRLSVMDVHEYIYYLIMCSEFT